MDKIKVNNQVILMRKVVKQAKLFTINKLTKLVKTYQNKKGTEDQKLKNERKVKRLFEKIAILKKMKPDSVSRMALSKAKDWNVILAQKNAPLDEQCLATLANCNEIQKEVEKFCSSQSHLVQKIPELIQEWEIKNQNPDNKRTNTMKASDIKRKKLEKISKRKLFQFKGASFPNNVQIASKSYVSNDGKQKTLLPETSKDENFDEVIKSENEALKQVNDEVLKNETEEMPESSFKADKSLDIKIEQINLSEVKQCHKNEIPSRGIPQVNSSKLKNASGKIKEKKLLKASREHTHNIMENVKNNSNDTSDTSQSIFKKLSAIAASDSKITFKQNGSKYTKAVAVLDLNSLKNSAEIPVGRPSSNDAELNDLPATHKKDSFFLTGDKSNDDSDDSDRGVKQPFKDGSHLRKRNYQNKYERNSFEDDNFRNQKKKFLGKDFSSNKNHFKQNNFQNRAFSSNKTHFKHGNDYNFGFSARLNKSNSFKSNSHQSKEFKSTHNGSSRFLMNNKSNTVKKDLKKQKQSPEKHGDKTNLHPSWEAKRKLKESLNSGGKGKRIVFND